LLAACANAVASTPPNKPSWALGDTLHVTGTLMDWAAGHHEIPPTDGNLFGEMNISEAARDGLEDGELIALGKVQPDASFEFGGMCVGADPSCITVPVTDVLCGGLSTSDPKAAINIIHSIFVPGIPMSEPPPPRLSGWVYIKMERPTSVWDASRGHGYTYAYADHDVTVRGSCAHIGPIALDLRKGWNSLEWDPSGGGFKTAAIPADARWWFFSSYTLGRNLRR
jgi:hypothetical protein